MSDNKRHIAILGSTGSIGTQTLEIVRAMPDRFEVELLTAYSNAQLLIEQAIEFKPNTVVIGKEELYDQVFAALDGQDIKVYAGANAIGAAVEADSIQLVVTAMVGYAGLIPTIRAIESGKHIALANKETLVVAGELITKLAQEKAVNIYPVDSEHSAIFQCLVGEFDNPIEKIILTASGGPFRGKSIDDLQHVTLEQALAHPNWTMGSKITIDSATLMNKGLEVIEAKWLFGLKPEQIDVIVHPQSIIHSMVQFEDGSIKAQLGLPDMKLPIQYAMGYPSRLKNDFKRFSFVDYPQLTFEQPDREAFPCLQLAFDALDKGGNASCVLNAANEIAVKQFLEGKIRFVEISEIIQNTFDKVGYIAQPSLEELVSTDEETRSRAVEYNN